MRRLGDFSLLHIFQSFKILRVKVFHDGLSLNVVQTAVHECLALFIAEFDAGQYEHGGANSRSIKMPRPHLSYDEAEEWCDNMINADGTKGCHWTLEQTQDVAKQRNINCDPNDFYAAMNMMYSDYCMIAKSYGIDTANFYADLAAAFLTDKDAVPGKIVEYWETIASG